jgi:hypothetical protein
LSTPVATAARLASPNESVMSCDPRELLSLSPMPPTDPIPPASMATRSAKDPLTRALGPEDGPGSGGRRKIAALSAAVHPLEHRVFLGAFDPNDQPTSIQERLVRMMPAAKRVLSAGDFREWDAIEAWAREMATNFVAETMTPHIRPAEGMRSATIPGREPCGQPADGPRHQTLGQARDPKVDPNLGSSEESVGPPGTTSQARFHAQTAVGRLGRW